MSLIEKNDKDILKLNGSNSNSDKSPYSKIRTNKEILDCAFHPDENSLLLTAALINGRIKIYDLLKGQKVDEETNSKKIKAKSKNLVSVQKIHSKSIRKISYPLNSSNLIFTASKDQSIKLTDFKQESNVLNLEEAHEYELTFFKFKRWIKNFILFFVKQKALQ
jgi:WD40 repeat protein